MRGALLSRKHFTVGSIQKIMHIAKWNNIAFTVEQAYPIQNALWAHQPYSECTLCAPTLFRMHCGRTNPIQNALYALQPYSECTVGAPTLFRMYCMHTNPIQNLLWACQPHSECTMGAPTLFKMDCMRTNPIQIPLWACQPYSECTMSAPILFRMHYGRTNPIQLHCGCTNPIQIKLCAPMHAIQGYTEGCALLCRKYRGRAYAMHNYTMGTSKSDYTAVTPTLCK